jgi:hypothetical protein
MIGLQGLSGINPAGDSVVARREYASVFVALLACLFVSLPIAAAERINHEGRILGSIPVVTNSLLFNTPQADAVISALQLFPPSNAWNEDISRRPLLSNSAGMVTQVINDLASNRRTLRPFQEMNFVIVPNNQPLVPIDLYEYPDESDPSPYPIPWSMPVELWPSQTDGQTLYDWQRDAQSWGGDRHSIILQPGTGRLWEMWQAQLIVSGGASNWQAANGALFNITNNALRPTGWTSADAAGLSMFAGLIRYDECERGTVEHAIRLIVARTRRAYIYPATHYASTSTNPNQPAMGQRFRLKSSFVIPDAWTKQEKGILRALQKYGAIVADNGGFFSISVAPDDRWPANAFSRLSSVSVTNFEVIATTGLTEGPRSPGAPLVHAGADQTIALGAAAPLRGAVLYTNAAPLTSRWQLYSGPGTVTFNPANATNTTATFSAPGTYTLTLSASNGVHAVAYDAVIITVQDTIRLSIARSGANLAVSWSGGRPPYILQSATELPAAFWTSVATNNGTNALIALPPARRFYRLVN